MTVDAEQIDVWCAFCDEIDDPQLLGAYARLLTPEEHQRQNRFHSAADRHRYLVTRALVRTTLSRYVPIAAEQWAFAADAYGRPKITNRDPAAARVSFNISHTTSLAVLAVTCDCRVGVDVENVGVRQAAIDVADHFFNPREVVSLRALPEEQRHERFFDYWTLKESYIKARGLGLSIRLDQFGFDFPEAGTVVLSMAPALNDRAGRWQFWQFRPADGFVMALCAERVAPSTPPQVQIRKIVPLSGDAPMACPLLRRSMPSGSADSSTAIPPRPLR